MNNYNLPLSGAVSQVINPWNTWMKSVGSQMGFINIRNVTSSDPEIEQAIIENVAGYGKQLGKINDLLSIMTNHLPSKQLSSEDKQVIDEFTKMQEHIEAVKESRQSPDSTLLALESILGDVKTLKTTEPALYQQAIASIKELVETV